MEIINKSELYKFAKKHSNFRKPIGNWLDVIEVAYWNNLSDVRQTFNSAYYTNELVIFNIGGNNYRLITSIDYENQEVFILEVMTHAEYDGWKP